MSIEKPEQFKKETELSSEVRDLILTFQKAKEARTEDEQNMLLEQFRLKLLKIVIPEGEGLPSENVQRLRKVLLEGSQNISNYIPVGGGTDGQRIWFRSQITVKGEGELDRLGKGANVEPFQDTYALDSKDDKPRWMAYYEPEGSSRGYGERYWKRYMEAFGNQVIDLLQELTNS